MKLFRHIYYHGNSLLCECYVHDDVNYKIKLETEVFFYQDNEDKWHTEYGNFDMVRKLKLKMKMWKMVGDEIHYKSEATVEDIRFDNEW